MAMSSQPQSSQSGQLTSDDLQEVFEAVYTILPNYVVFGMKLNVPLNFIRVTEKQYANPCDCLLQILDYRLKQLPPLTWYEIVQALQSPTVQQHDLARTIESQYITASESPALVSQHASAESSHAAIHTSGAQLSINSTHAPSQPQPLTPITQPSSQHVREFSFQQASFIPSQSQPTYLYQNSSPMQQNSYTRFPIPQPAALPLNPRFPSDVADGEAHIPTNAVASSVTHPAPQPASLPFQAQGVQKPPISTNSSFIHASIGATSPDVQSQSPESNNPQAKRPCLESSVHTHLSSSHMQPPSPTSRGDITLAQRLKHYISRTHLSFQDSTSTLYILQFIAYIRDIYRRSIVGDCKDTKWPPRASEVFIKLAIIDQKSVYFREVYEDTMAMVMHGNVDAILHKKRSIKLNEVAKDVPENRIVVVEGAPGVGKSTFAWEFCRQWERGKIAQQYQLVLLLRLRDEGMSRVQNVNDLIYHPDEVVCQSMLQELNVNHGSNVLFILEGFDELPDTCRAKSSIFMKLIYGNILYKSTVLITSRSWATDIIHRDNADRIFQHIEILGFTEPQIKEYVTSALSNPDNYLNENAKDDFDDIIKYIDTYPQIKACMYIPLNTAIVVGVYEESKAGRCSLPKTLTQLYQALIQTILVRYLHGHPEYSQQRWNVRDLKKDLPQEVFENFEDICHVAYKGIFKPEQKVQLVFSDLPEDFESLGLMQSVAQLNTTQGEVLSHNFLHLTVQEFLTAMHISFMSSENKLEHFKRCDEGRLGVVLRFLSGLTELANITLEEFKGLLGKCPKQNLHGQQITDIYYKQMIPDMYIGTQHINWLFEAQNTDFLKSLLHSHTIRFVFTQGMLPLEYYSIGYCIVHSKCNWSLIFYEEPEKENLHLLSKGTNTRTGNEHRVALRTNASVSNETSRILLLTFSSCLEELYLDIDENASPKLLLTDLPVLRILELGISTKFFDLCSEVSFQSLESLKIYNRHISGSTQSSQAAERSGGIKRNADLVLRNLVLEIECTFGYKAVKLLAQFIRKSTSCHFLRIIIKYAEFSGCQLMELTEAIHNCTSSHDKLLHKLRFNVESSEDARQLIQLFHAYPDMLDTIDWVVVLTIFRRKRTYNYDNISALTLAVALCHNIFRYQSLYIYNRNINSDAAAVLAEALRYNSTLWVFDLSCNSICDTGAAALAQALHHNSTLVRLDVSNNSISDAGAVALAGALNHNSTLKWLNLSSNNIADAGVAALAQTLHHNTTLKWLDLSSNTIADSGAVTLAGALNHNSTLKWLNLSSNNIADAGVEALAQTLHHTLLPIEGQFFDN